MDSTSTGGGAPAAALPVSLSQREYETLRARLILNFRVAVVTNVLAVLILVGSTVSAAVFALLDEPAPAAIFGTLSFVDLAYAVLERPWRELLLANNRLALSQSVWIAYVESKDAIEQGFPRDLQPDILGRAQNLWIDRTAVIAQDDFPQVINDLREINRGVGADREERPPEPAPAAPVPAAPPAAVPEAPGGDGEAPPAPAAETSGNGSAPPPLEFPVAEPAGGRDFSLEQRPLQSPVQITKVAYSGTDWLGAAQAARQELETPTLLGLRILWVDDNPQNNTALVGRLSRAGARLTIVRSTDEMRASLAEGEFDVIISDVRRALGSDAPLPEAGFAAVEALRAEGTLTPVIFYAGQIDGRRKARAMELRAKITNNARQLITELERVYQ